MLTFDSPVPADVIERLVHPGDPDWDEARSAWNLTADQQPAAVLRATSVPDVQAAMALARARGWRVAAQTTGHSAHALPDLRDTLLLRLALHQSVDVDPDARVARIIAGARWDDVVKAVAPHGLAVMHGSSPSVGVVGYLLGGGLSFYGRAHGLAANHVRAFEVVTPDGAFRRVDAGHDGDLFWALRGGGGGYAVVTAVELALLPYAEVTGGAMFFPVQAAWAVLRAWRDWTAHAPDSITTTFRMLCLPDMPQVPEPLRGVPTVCVDGVSLDPAEAAGLETSLRWAATPTMGGFGPMPSAAVARMHGDPEDPVPGMGDGMLLETLDDWAIEAFLRVTGPGSPLLSAELRHLGGALTSPPADAGARGHLEGSYAMYGVGIPSAPAPAHQLDAYLDRYQAAMQPWSTGTKFASFAERTNSIESSVPAEAFRRLQVVRRRFDPDEVLVAPYLPVSQTDC